MENEYKYWFMWQKNDLTPKESYRITTPVPIQKGDIITIRGTHKRNIKGIERVSIKVTGISHLFVAPGMYDTATRLFVEKANDNDTEDDSVALP